jgi:hypothetical protein
MIVSCPAICVWAISCQPPVGIKSQINDTLLKAWSGLDFTDLCTCRYITALLVFWQFLSNLQLEFIELL